MDFFKLLKSEFSGFELNSAKIHLAVWNGEQNPLDEYLSGGFERWQRWQTKKNFEREFIISLIQLRGENRWLFAGLYKSLSSAYLEEHKCYLYETEEISQLHTLSGRLIVNFKRTGRQSYLVAENWLGEFSVCEMLPQKLEIESFQGYSQSLIKKSKLDIIVKQNLESWRSALENVSGVYLITDVSTGKLYVGSATGEGGIWQRWCQYSYSGHGNNRDLVALLREKGQSYSSNFQFSVLEIADTHTSNNIVLQRENYWKMVLCTREHGYNAN